MSDIVTLAKPIAVHLHLYYTDMWDELRNQLQNIEPTPYDLYVTLVKEDSNLASEIRQFKPDAHISVVKNMGYDVGPFIEFLNQIDLDKYSYILKLHSKRATNGADTKINGFFVSRYWWKVLLSEALIGSEKIWKNNLKKLEKDNKLGMIASPHLIKSNEKTDASLLPNMQKQLQKLGFPEVNDFLFVAGTMFIVRSSLFKPLQHHYTIDDFQITDGTIKDGTLAHVMERLFGAIIKAQDYKIKGFSHNPLFIGYCLGKIILRFFYQKKKTKNNKILVKICKLPVYSKKAA